LEAQKASVEDSKSVAEVFDQYRVFYGQASDLALATEFIHQRLLQEESVIFVVRGENAAIIGFTQLYPSFSSVSAQRTWVLNDLYVCADSRGQGIATLLLQAARDFAVETGAKGVGLQTMHDNLPAQRLYEHFGFKRSTDFYSYFLSL